jgi:hypothetical protein
VYHLIARFVAKEWFIESAVERRVYLSLLGHAIAMTDWRCFAFAVMSSHVHLGVLAGAIPLADWLRPMHTNFAQWINVRRERIGAVFVRGPNVIAVQPEGTARLINYIHCNPVRAGVVASPRDSDWTSHRAYVGLAQRPSWLNVECGLELAGLDSASALAAWIESTRTDRSDLDAVRLLPYVGPGRPRLAQVGAGARSADHAIPA